VDTASSSKSSGKDAVVEIPASDITLYASALRPILVEHDTSYPLPPLILLLDLTRLDIEGHLDQETGKMEFTKSGLGKVTARTIEKVRFWEGNHNSLK